MATLPCHNVGWVEELKSLIVKPVDEFRGPWGDGRVWEGPYM